MGKFRIAAALVAGFGLIGAAAPEACTAPPTTTDVRVAVPMTCTGGTAVTVTVSATPPTQVRAGRAYTVTKLTSDAPNSGAATIAASAGQPATFAAGSGGSSTLQLVGPTPPGSPITLQVAEAGYLLPGTIAGGIGPVIIPGSAIHCTPDAPVTRGSIDVLGQGAGPDTATAAVNTFTLADLHLETPGLPFAAIPAAVVDGADPQAITPTGVHTVTAGNRPLVASPAGACWGAGKGRDRCGSSGSSPCSSPCAP